MNDIDSINALVNAGTSAVFLWLYWRERQRSQQLSDERIVLLQDCMERLEKRRKPDNPPTPSSKFDT
jgi:hypothetical protein